MGCGLSRGREESFYDLMLQVRGNASLEESLMAFVTPELLDGGNQYFCELCAKKCDARKGMKLRRLPPVLTLSLNRFEFDYETCERKKVNDQFEFGLELDLTPFMETEDNSVNYEL